VSRSPAGSIRSRREPDLAGPGAPGFAAPLRKTGFIVDFAQLEKHGYHCRDALVLRLIEWGVRRIYGYPVTA